MSKYEIPHSWLMYLPNYKPMFRLMSLSEAREECCRIIEESVNRLREIDNEMTECAERSWGSELVQKAKDDFLYAENTRTDKKEKL